ncbi:hypothetical protein BGW38_010354 [Lunasporangiospora selenospora]|uniref:Uncharacterized protein n=1 Tax=Lunasporangiospora selenospora TaxID=979761 RepID=A0A9P6G269_9FUNG|nr:hypothetical protein BGW38_010354 [Lunasporangiospora selenospora]
MPPRRANGGAVATTRTRTMDSSIVAAARKRKSMDRSDDDAEDYDSDFAYANRHVHRHPSQRTGSKTKTSRSKAHQTVPSLSSSDSSSPTAPAHAESWKSELSELEDRGFVFSRKKVAVNGVDASAKSSKKGNSTPNHSSAQSKEADANARLSPPQLSTPDRTPTRSAVYGKQWEAAVPSKSSSGNLGRGRDSTPARRSESIVTIPMRETPTIKRNKDMRGANRRSSLAQRGKRASSIGSGIVNSGSAVPQGDEPIAMSGTLTEEIELDVLTADERTLLEKHCQHESGATATLDSAAQDKLNKATGDCKWLVELMSNLEQEVDRFHDTLYATSRFNRVAMQYTDQVLEQAAEALEQRQRPLTSDCIYLSSSSAPSSKSIVTMGSEARTGGSALTSTLSNSGSTLPPTLTATGGGNATGSLSSNLVADAADDPRQILRALSRLCI